MPKVTFITADGEQVVVKNAQGTLMEAAVEHKVEGIVGDCSGVGSCGTCHVCIVPEWMDCAGPTSELERDVIGQQYIMPGSRLACQINLTEKLDGLVVHVPPR